MNNINLRRANAFEVILLCVGIAIGFIGFILINKMYILQGGLSWSMLIASFLWLMLIVLLILTATMEDVKEELSVLIKEQVEETKILRDLEHDTLKEIKLLREDLNGKKRSRK